MATYIAEITHTITRNYEITVPDSVHPDLVREWVTHHSDEVYQERSETTWDLDDAMDGDIVKDGPIQIGIKLSFEDGEYDVQGFVKN